MEGSICFEWYTAHHQELQLYLQPLAYIRMWWPAVVKSECELQFPLRLDYGQSPHAYVNQRLQIQLELLMTSGVPLETCWAFNERWNNKFCYKVASSWLFIQSPHAYVNQRLQIQLELLMTSGVPLETCWAFNERWNNKFYYKVASCWLFILSHTTKHGSMNIKFLTKLHTPLRHEFQLI
jgi:hypothetical protein